MMKPASFASPLAACVLALIAGPALAVPIQADFYESLDFPSFSAGPRELVALDRSFGAGAELDVDDALDGVGDNPEDFGGLVQIDFDTDGLGFTLTQAGGAADFEELIIEITDVRFSRSQRFDAVYLDSASLVDGDTSTGAVIETVSFGDDSIYLSFVGTLVSDESFFFHVGGSAHYTLALIDTPLPAAAPLLAAGLGVMGVAARRRRVRSA